MTEKGTVPKTNMDIEYAPFAIGKIPLQMVDFPLLC